MWTDMTVVVCVYVCFVPCEHGMNEKDRNKNKVNLHPTPGQGHLGRTGHGHGVI